MEINITKISLGLRHRRSFRIPEIAGAKYTSKRRPVFLEHIESFGSRKDAMIREKEIKHFSHSKKQEIINGATKFDILSSI